MINLQKSTFADLEDILRAVAHELRQRQKVIRTADLALDPGGEYRIDLQLVRNGLDAAISAIMDAVENIPVKNGEFEIDNCVFALFGE